MILFIEQYNIAFNDYNIIINIRQSDMGSDRLAIKNPCLYKTTKFRKKEMLEEDRLLRRRLDTVLSLVTHGSQMTE